MTRILACTTGPDDWNRFLADPARQWRSGYSAKALAHSWEAADAMPPEVSDALRSAPDFAFEFVQPFLAIPEYQIELPGGGRPSQSDVLVLGRAQGGAFALTVEGKVAESLGPTLGEWFSEPSEGKKRRWAFICKTLGIGEIQEHRLRYQLFHRTVSAILTARLHHATLAVVLIHSFHADRPGFDDFKQFFGLFDATISPGKVVPIATFGDVRLYAGWADGDLRFTKL